MKIFLSIFFSLCLHHIVFAHTGTDTIPVSLPASFMDDYGSKYVISDTLWQQGSSKYHILKWNKAEQYIIAQNDINNSSEKGLFTRIDYMSFTGMPPYTWGYCYTMYDAKTQVQAEQGPNKTDRANPRKGCNGYPFSRMKPAQ